MGTEFGPKKEPNQELNPVIGRWINYLGKFLEEPRPDERPLAYIATRKHTLKRRDEEGNQKELYPVSEMTQDSFMEEIYPVDDYLDYRDYIDTTEDWLAMPGFDLYIVPIELNSQDLYYSFAEQVGNAFGKILATPDWTDTINPDSSEEEKNLQANVPDMGKLAEYMSVLGPVFHNSGPLDLPHYHASVCIGLDNYAAGWLFLNDYQVKKEDGKTVPKRFDQKFSHLGLKYGELLTVRYKSYKPGILGGVQRHFMDEAIIDLSYIPEQLEEKVEKFRDNLELLEKFGFSLDDVESRTSDERNVLLRGLQNFLETPAIGNEATFLALDLIDTIKALDSIQNEIAKKAEVLFEEFTLKYFGLTVEEFEKAYQRRIDWLVKKADEALIDFAHRIGLVPIIKRSCWNDVLGHLVTDDDFVPGGILISKEFDESLGGNTEMIKAYPVKKSGPDLNLSPNR